MKVVDWKGNEIKIGSRVLYGAPETPEEVEGQTAVVTAISDPDVVYNPVTDADDGGYEVLIVVQFPSGGVETLHAPYSSKNNAAQWEAGEEPDELFEESGDLEVLA